MHDVDYLRTLSHSELVDLALKKDAASRDLRKQLRDNIMTRLWAEKEAQLYRNAVTEILLEVHGRGNCGFRKRIIDNVERIAENALSQIERPNELPF